MAAAGTRRFYAGLGVITALALAWRIGYVVWQEGRLDLYGDASYYHWQANDIAAGHWFIDPWQWRFYGRQTPSALHPPAYVTYLAAVSRFVGSSETTHRIASTLLGTGAVLTLGLVARRVFASNWAGWIAAALAGAYAHLWINDEMLMSESMYVLMVSVALLCTYRFWDAPRWQSAALMGGAYGLAALSRAESALMFVLVVVPLALLLRDQPWRRRLGLAATACAVGAAVLLPWLVYNRARFEHPVLLSTGLGPVLMVGNCEYENPDDGTLISSYNGWLAGYWNFGCAAWLERRLDEHLSADDASEAKAELGIIPGSTELFFGDESRHEVGRRTIALSEMDRNRGELPRVAALRILRMWDVYRPGQSVDPLNAYVEGRGLWQSRLAAYQYYPLLALAIGGLVVLRRRRVPILPFVALAALITVTAATSFGITRYRAGVDAMLPVLASGAIVAIARAVRPVIGWQRRSRDDDGRREACPSDATAVARRGTS